MGMYDEVKLNHPMFGEDMGHIGQSKDTPNQFLDDYEITPAGRLVLCEDYVLEDHSDPTREGLAALVGCMDRVPTGKGPIDTDYHGYLWVWGKGNYRWQCKFTDGYLVSAEKVELE